MSNNLNQSIWLIGVGPIAIDYLKVLNDLKVKYEVIGRGEKSSKSFTERTGIQPIVGGLIHFLSSNPNICSHAIVSVGIEELANVTIQLLEYGVKNILVEKPAGLNKGEIESVADHTKKKNANVYVAYNRRFYASVIKAKDIIIRDGGVTSFNFEFTEWAHEIEKLEKAPGVKESWFLANSTHVIDLAYYLGGRPKEIATFVNGSLDWHPSASIFSGSGVSETGALFSYQANWESAGRWSVEMLTNEHRLIFRPIEKLQIQKRDSVQIGYVDEIDYLLDEQYKPGLFLQTSNFLNNNFENMLDIHQHSSKIKVYYKMANYH